MNQPIPDSGTDVNGIVKKKRCERGIEPVLKELGSTDRENLVQDSSCYGLNQGYVIDVTKMNLSDYLVPSKCEMMLN